MPKKNKKVLFSVDNTTYETWNLIADELIRRRMFRSKADIFESLVYYLQRADNEDIKKFKTTTMII